MLITLRSAMYSQQTPASLGSGCRLHASVDTENSGWKALWIFHDPQNVNHKRRAANPRPQDALSAICHPSTALKQARQEPAVSSLPDKQRKAVVVHESKVASLTFALLT